MSTRESTITPRIRAEAAPLAVSVRHTEQMLNATHRRVYELINTGELDSFLLGRARRITTASIHALIARRIANSSQTERSHPRRRPAPATCSSK